MTAPKYDPAELAAADLTEEEAEGIRTALDEIERGETVSGDEFFAQLERELAALERARRRAG